MRLSARPERPSRSRLWILLLAIGLVGAGSGAVLLFRTAPRAAASAATVAPAPIASVSPATDSAVPPAVPPAGQSGAAQELARLAPELTPASADMLVREVSYASGVRLAETGLVLATRGFDTMERTNLAELARIFEEVYGTLPRADHDWMTEYMRMVRDGTLDAKASARGRRLLTQGVESLPSARRARLQALLEKAIRAGIESRRESEARTQQAALTAPPPPAAAPAPESARTATAATPAPSETSAAAPGDAGSNTRGEAYWRSRMEGLRGRVASLKAQIARLEQTASREVYGPSVQPRCHAPERITTESQQAFEKCAQALQNYPAQQSAAQAARLFELEQLREQLKLTERAILDLEDQARRAGALPGWLRD